MAGYFLAMFDYKAYMDAIRPIVEVADRSDYDAAIQSLARELSDLTKIRESFEDLFTSYLDIDNWPDYRLDTAWILGEALFGLALKYCSATQEAYGFHLTALSMICAELNFPRRSCELLFYGLDTSILAKPRQDKDPLQRHDLLKAENSSPETYWMHIRSTHSMSVGWWRTSDLIELRQLVEETYRRFKVLDLDRPEYERLRKHLEFSRFRLTRFEDLLDLYNMVIASNLGLFGIFG